jgi:hypothetical protein
MGHRIKRGMGGSRNGRGRTDGTEVLKAESSKLRRAEDTSEIAEQWTPEPGEVVTSDSHTATVQVTINHQGTLDLDVLKRLIQERYKVARIERVDESTRVTKL